AASQACAEPFAFESDAYQNRAQAIADRREERKEIAFRIFRLETRGPFGVDCGDLLVGHGMLYGARPGTPALAHGEARSDEHERDPENTQRGELFAQQPDRERERDDEMHLLDRRHEIGAHRARGAVVAIA